MEKTRPRVAIYREFQHARIGFGFEIQQEKLDFEMKLIHSLKQDNVAVHDDHSEDITESYSLLSAFASYDINIGDNVGTLFLRGNNLTDELAYNHASLLKSHALSLVVASKSGLNLISKVFGKIKFKIFRYRNVTK